MTMSEPVLTKRIPTPPWGDFADRHLVTYDEYVKTGGYQALEQARSALEDYLPPQCEVAMEMAEEARAGAHEGTLACDHQLHDATLPSTILTDEIRERLCEERAAISSRG